MFPAVALLPGSACRRRQSRFSFDHTTGHATRTRKSGPHSHALRRWGHPRGRPPSAARYSFMFGSRIFSRIRAAGGCALLSRSQLSDPPRRWLPARQRPCTCGVSRSQLSDPLRRLLSEAVDSKAVTADLASGPCEARLNRPSAKASRDINRASASGYAFASGCRVFGATSPLALSKSMGLAPTDETGVEAEDAICRSNVPIGL